MAAGAVPAPLIIPITQPVAHRAKNHIDTNTPVSLHTGMAGVMIFFTLDGSKPVAGKRGTDGSTKKYTLPLLLPAGRVTIRAVAITSDGRQSSVVTKVFSVDLADNDLQNHQQLQCQSEGTFFMNASSSLRSAESNVMGNGIRQSGPRFLNNRLGPGNAATIAAGTRNTSSQGSQPEGPDKLSSTQTSRVQRHTNFLRCPQCLSVRPSDPFARFCTQCGAMVPPLPAQRLPPTEGGQTLLCLFCNALVPINAQTCLICEASIQPQLQPQARRKLQDHALCGYCGSGNPAHISTCVICESRLQPVEGFGSSSTPSVPGPEGRMLSCSRCKRMNRSDARYCDWCGSKPGHAVGCVMCWRCGASGHPYTLYCGSCGVFLEPPHPSRSHITRPVQSRDVSAGDPVTSTSHDASWQAAPSSNLAMSVKVALPTVDQGTQTVGIFYPSATQLQKKEQEKMLQLCREQAGGNRRPPLTAVSPGRGYWRRQLDHVCGHLRSYAQNNVPFRTLLGEPRMGRMVSAVIQEDRYEVSLTVSFALFGREEKKVDPDDDDVGPGAGGLRPASRAETLSSVTEQAVGSSILKSSRLTPKLNPKSNPRVKDVLLLEELGPGRGNVNAVQELLDQGAEPSCCGSDGLHALSVAVINGHHDVLPMLVQRGADVDQQSGRMKNTALHEAAALGSEGLQCSKVLLSCGATVKRRNAAGQTAYDVSLDSGCSSMTSLLAAQTGHSLLGTLNLDMF